MRLVAREAGRERPGLGGGADPGAPGATGRPGTGRERLAEVNDQLGLTGGERLTAFQKERGEEGGYVFVGTAGYCRVTPKQLVEFRYAQPAIMEATGMLVASMTKAAWQRVVRMLLQAATPLDLGDEATPGGRGRSLLRAYLENRTPVEDRDEATLTKYPFVEGGRVHVFGVAMMMWLRTERFRVMSEVEFGRVMRAAECEPVRVHVTLEDGKRTKWSAWKVPADLY